MTDSNNTGSIDFDLAIQPMSAADRAAFSVTSEEEQDLSMWLARRCAAIVGREGRGGTGVLVELPGGETGVLTAKHVILELLHGEEISVLPLGRRMESLLLDSVVLHPRRDLALLRVAELPRDIDRLSLSDWSESGPPPDLGTKIISCGFPGKLKDIDAANRRMSGKFLFYWSTAGDPGVRVDHVACDLDETNKELPETLRGVSGGPCFDLDRRFVGINVLEERRRPADPSTGRLLIVPGSEARKLTEPLQFKAERADQYKFCGCQVRLKAYPSWDPTRIMSFVAFAKLLFLAEEPHNDEGKIGLLEKLVYEEPEGTGRLALNTPCRFDYWFYDDTPRAKAQAVRDEVESILQAGGFVTLPLPPE